MINKEFLTYRIMKGHLSFRRGGLSLFILEPDPDMMYRSTEIYEDIFFRPNIGFQYDSLGITGTVSNLLRSRQGDTLSSSVGYLFSVDKRDSKFNPTSGTVFYFSQDIA